MPQNQTGRSRGRDVVGISLMVSAETEAVIAYLNERVPDASISFRDCFYKIERSALLEFDLSVIADYLGRPLDTESFLVNMSSYYGRIVVEGNRVCIRAEIE
jgi:hypothetical protein